MITIKAKNKDYNGILSGIVFVKGEAKTKTLSEYDEHWFERKGFKVERITPEKSKTKAKAKDKDVEEKES